MLIDSTYIGRRILNLQFNYALPYAIIFRAFSAYLLYYQFATTQPEGLTAMALGNRPEELIKHELKALKGRR